MARSQSRQGSGPPGGTDTLTVETVALAAHRLLDAVPLQDLAVGLGSVLGGFKRSSQHLDRGGCGDYPKAAFGSVGARRIALAGPARGGAARGPAAVLGGDRGGAVQRGRGG